MRVVNSCRGILFCRQTTLEQLQPPKWHWNIHHETWERNCVWNYAWKYIRIWLLFPHKCAVVHTYGCMCIPILSIAVGNVLFKILQGCNPGQHMLYIAWGTSLTSQYLQNRSNNYFGVAINRWRPKWRKHVGLALCRIPASRIPLLHQHHCQISGSRAVFKYVSLHVSPRTVKLLIYAIK
jgi:hypothetical protein